MTPPANEPIPATAVGHAHVADLETCLDLINSLEYEDGQPDEHLPTVDAAIEYFTRRGIAHADALRSDATHDPVAWISRIRRTRGALREVWDAAVEGRTADVAAVATLNEALAHTPRTELHAALGGVVVDHRHEAADPTGEALARVVEPLVVALAAGHTARFRICANDGCRWVFEDTSRGGRRRWCDMSSCGNRAKVRRHRSKRRDESVAGAASEAGSTRPSSGSVPVDAAAETTA
jgi:predicted RNA-binding Zn ribbon-like protein